MQQDQHENSYYEKVGKYYNDDAPRFEKRYNENKTIQKIRFSFRDTTDKYDFKNALEIGFGTGVDLIYFSQKYPDRNFYGIDVSYGMYEQAEQQIKKSGAKNIQIKIGAVEDVEQLFPNQQFDLIYIFFGALNTVEDLSKIAQILENILEPNGTLVITVINKWYLMGIFLPMIKGRFKIAFKRLQPNWGGYSPCRHLDSKCYSPREFKKYFPAFRNVEQQGYSIIYPAWYQDNLRKKMGDKIFNTLWKIDRLLQYTPFWSKGEYTSFVFKHR